jgi:hypothetical protein
MLGHSRLLASRPPRPVRTGLPYLALAVFVFATGILSSVPAAAAGEFALLIVIVGAGFTLYDYLQLAGLRNEADRALLAGETDVPWRIDELVGSRHRRMLARSVNGIVRDLRSATLPGASPLNRVAARPHASLFAAIAARLSDRGQRVSPGGVLRVEALLTDTAGPLYAPERAPQLEWALRSALASLNDTDAYTADRRHDDDADRARRSLRLISPRGSTTSPAPCERIGKDARLDQQ